MYFIIIAKCFGFVRNVVIFNPQANAVDYMQVSGELYEVCCRFQLETVRPNSYKNKNPALPSIGVNAHNK